MAEKLEEFYGFFDPMMPKSPTKVQRRDTLSGPVSTSDKAVKDHFAGKEELFPHFEQLIEQLRGMNIQFQINPEPRNYIALVGERKAFAWLHPKREWIRVDLRLSSSEAGEAAYKPWSEKDDGGYYHFESISQLPIVAKLIEKAHQKANGNERISR